MRAIATFVMLCSAILLASLVLVIPLHAQDQSSSATCTFDDGREVSVRYSFGHASERLRSGKMWTPGDAPMFLFTQAPLKAGDLTLPVGAYSLYVIPQKNKWTLIINKGVDPAAKYDEKQDVGRVEMEVGELGEAVESPRLAFAHAGSKQCNLRINYEKSGAWGEFREE